MITALAMTPVAAQAQSPAEREQAGTYYKAGAEAYFKEDFAQAIINFKAGYDLDPNPIFLYNLSLSYAKLGNLDEALIQAYAAEKMGGLDPQTSAKNRSRLRAYETLLSAAATAEGAHSEPTGCTSDDDCSSGQTCESDTGVCIAEPTDDEEAPEGDFFDSVPFSVWGWAGAGVATAGLALTISALVVDGSLADDRERYDRYLDEGRTAEARALASDIESTRSTGLVLLYGGIVLMAAGGGLLAYDLFLDGDGPFTDASVVPALGPDAASVDLRLRF